MNLRAQVSFLPDGRLHLHDGPIDLIVSAEGGASARNNAYRAAVKRFETILNELCDELCLLRSSARDDSQHLHGSVAKTMNDACALFLADGFITPMAAVAGSVAQHVLAAMTEVTSLTRAYVNNGGDIALYLAPRSSFTVGLVQSIDQPAINATMRVGAEDGIGGIATSGRNGRSFSLGIADAVTVLASTAAIADAAATVIANAIDLPDHTSIKRQPACEIKPDSDLGERLVTISVGRLSMADIQRALDAGVGKAEMLLIRGHIQAAALHLSGHTRIVDANNAGSFNALPATRSPLPFHSAIVASGHASRCSQILSHPSGLQGNPHLFFFHRTGSQTL
ncbi:MAG: UPF0280 family protein [Beijerinckiaceae bacterium]